ncbi:hypothetical protein J6590_026713 [Homalodisca vitripennis]|nr:hypothetical protein J6590_026713 [Homalodisca vitripennis]
MFLIWFQCSVSIGLFIHCLFTARTDEIVKSDIWYHFKEGFNNATSTDVILGIILYWQQKLHFGGRTRRTTVARQPLTMDR